MSGRPWLIAVTVDGVNLPRFLRRAGEMGLLLTGVRIRGKHLSAFAREDDVMTLRMMAENGGWRYNYGNMFYVKLVKQFLTQTGGDALGTDVQNRIAEIARNSGSYGIPATGGLCETWVEAVYRKAGVSINNICCAGKNRSLYAVSKSSANIPIGAMVYNDPAVYQSRTTDSYCGLNAGHVGIYIGNNQFVHASTSSGVIISSMNEPYWKKRYNEARRVLSRS